MPPRKANLSFSNAETAEISDHGRLWTVRLVRPGDRYGSRLQLVHGNERTSLGSEPLIEFFDGRYANDPRFVKIDPENAPFGQFVSRYYVDTLLKSRRTRETHGLDLQSDVPAWKVSSDGMRDVYHWLDMLGYGGEKISDYPVSDKFVSEVKKKYRVNVHYDQPSGRGSIQFPLNSMRISFAPSSNEPSIFLNVFIDSKLKCEDSEQAMKLVTDLWTAVSKL